MSEKSKELVAAKSQVTKATVAAGELVIDSQESFEGANELLAKIKKVQKFVTEKKEGFTRPAYQAYKEIMEQAKDMFDPLINDCNAAEKIVKAKAITYRNEVNRKAEEEEKRIADRVEAGKLKPETASKKMEVVQEKKVEARVEGKTGGMQFKKVKEMTVVDKMAVIKAVAEGLIVIDAVDLNTRVLRDLAVKQGIAVPGVEVKEVDQVSGV